jgi:hypothetical protein
VRLTDRNEPPARPQAPAPVQRELHTDAPMVDMDPAPAPDTGAAPALDTGPTPTKEPVIAPAGPEAPT